MNTKSLKKAVIAAAAALAMTACSASGSSAAASGSSAHAAEITVALNAQFTTLDPALNTETINNHVLQSIYSTLFVKDADNVAQYGVCSDYTVSDDGLVYTFTLRDDVVWTDGTPVTAYDFEYAMLRALSYGADNAFAINNLNSFVAGAADYSANALAVGESFDCTVEENTTGIKAIDDTTLEITLCTPCAYLTGLMASGAWTAVPQSTPQHDSTWSMTAGYVTNGAYTLDEFSENEAAVLVKNDSWYDADTITMDKITYQVMTDDNAQDIAFKSEEIDVATKVATDTALGYVDTDTLWLISTPINYFLAINSGSTGPEWAKNVNVRKALAMAINRDEIVSVLGAEFYPTIEGYVPYGMGGNDGDYREEGDATANHPQYDPEAAKELLAQEGYDESNPLTITYKYSNNGVHGDVATVLEQQWEAIGVNVEFAAVESGVFYDQLDQGDFEIARYGLSATDSPMQFLDIWTTGMQVVAAVDDETYNQMVSDAKYIVDSEEYINALHDAEAYLYDENVYVIPLFQNTSQYLVADGLKGYTMHGAYAWYGNAYWE